MKLRKGSHDATGLRFGIVVARFNKFVTSKLLSSCLDGLTMHGVKPDDIEAVRVPGAFESAMRCQHGRPRADTMQKTANGACAVAAEAAMKSRRFME